MTERERGKREGEGERVKGKDRTRWCTGVELYELLNISPHSPVGFPGEEAGGRRDWSGAAAEAAELWPSPAATTRLPLPLPAEAPPPSEAIAGGGEGRGESTGPPTSIECLVRRKNGAPTVPRDGRAAPCGPAGWASETDKDEAYIILTWTSAPTPPIATANPTAADAASSPHPPRCRRVSVAAMSTMMRSRTGPSTIRKETEPPTSGDGRCNQSPNELIVEAATKVH
uniref:Uncharacterized protein n=1 Tax=Oryza punctata TaxID=4537 RepID=A0A0E0M8J7_ORYPU